MRLENKTAIVTGGASGFGEAIVKKFLAEGAQVVIADINQKAAEELSQTLGANTFAAHCDVGDSASVNALKTQATAALGEIDIIVNNAGVTHLPTPLDEVNEEDFDRVFRVNCKSVYLMAQAFVPDMKSRKSGNILNIASTAGVSPRPNLNWYNSSKGWMNTATRTMAIELAPFNIRVNAVNPVAGKRHFWPLSLAKIRRSGGRNFSLPYHLAALQCPMILQMRPAIMFGRSEHGDGRLYAG